MKNELTIEFIISTMNKVDFSFVNNMFRHIDQNDFQILVINQHTIGENKKITEVETERFRLINTYDRGLSKSRNLGIEHAKGDICIFTDDDVTFQPNAITIIKESFSQPIDASTFMAYFDNGLPMKSYRSNPFKHNIKSIMRVSSIECAFRLDFLKKNNLKYDNLFGLGAKFPASEENIFLRDVLESNGKVYFFPRKFVEHPFENTGGILNEKGIYTRGAAFKRIFGGSGLFIGFIFLIMKRKHLSKFNLTFLKATKLFLKGYKDYTTILKTV